eukprot:3292982-Rhodomonas_salina.2
MRAAAFLAHARARRLVFDSAVREAWSCQWHCADRGTNSQEPVRACCTGRGGCTQPGCAVLTRCTGRGGVPGVGCGTVGAGDGGDAGEGGGLQGHGRSAGDRHAPRCALRLFMGQ